MALNNACIMGRLCADPDVKCTQSGTEFCRFSVAVDRRFKKDNEPQADFIDCLAWKQTAVFINKFFHKGSMIAIQGYIQTGTYEDKNGNKRKSFDIVADNVSFCGGKNETGGNATAASEAKPTSVVNLNVSVEEVNAEVNDDDLPF